MLATWSFNDVNLSEQSLDRMQEELSDFGLYFFGSKDVVPVIDDEYSSDDEIFLVINRIELMVSRNIGSALSKHFLDEFGSFSVETQDGGKVLLPTSVAYEETKGTFKCTTLARRMPS